MTNKPDPINEPRPPSCPECKKQMPLMVLFPYQMTENMILATAQCPFCAVLLHSEFIFTAPPAPPDPDEPPQKGKVWTPQ